MSSYRFLSFSFFWGHAVCPGNLPLSVDSLVTANNKPTLLTCSPSESYMYVVGIHIDNRMIIVFHSV